MNLEMPYEAKAIGVKLFIQFDSAGFTGVTSVEHRG